MGKQRGSLAGLENSSNTSALPPSEYADLDSIASAVAFAYLQSRVAPDRESTAYLPLVNIPRADLKLRTDCLWLLTDSGVDVAALAFADEVRVEGMYHTSCMDDPMMRQEESGRSTWRL